MSGIVIVNGAAGAGPDGDAISTGFAGHDVRHCEPDDLSAAFDDAVAARPDFLGVAGGDGTIRSAVAAVQGTGIPLLVIPAGTRNHFARDIGVPQLSDAVAAAESGRRVKVDIGRVNGEVFVNNATIGLYPQLVRRREAMQDRLSKTTATLAAGWQQLRSAKKIWIADDNGRRRVWMVFVGNGCYGTGLTDLADRACLDDGLLDVRVVRAEGKLARVRVVLAVLFHRLERSPLIDRDMVPAVTFDVDRPLVHVALDGEVRTLTPPLTYTVDPSALEVLIP